MTTNFLIRRLVKQNDAHKKAVVHSSHVVLETQRTKWFNKPVVTKTVPVVAEIVDKMSERRSKLKAALDKELIELEKELNFYGLAIRPSP
jgi:hypothetical protein